MGLSVEKESYLLYDYLTATADLAEKFTSLNSDAGSGEDYRGCGMMSESIHDPESLRASVEVLNKNYYNSTTAEGRHV